MSSHLEMTCHCGSVKQSLQPRSPTRPSLSLCHCNTCRHVTGALCTSYYPIGQPSLLDGMTRYESSPHSTHYFCSTCGCHVFRQIVDQATPGGAYNWEVASGVLTDGLDVASHVAEANTIKFRKQLHVQDTLDGGLSTWLTGGPLGGIDLSDEQDMGRNPEDELPSSVEETTEGNDTGPVLQAGCHCLGVKFHITRPNESSKAPVSHYSDLIIPFHTKDPNIANPDNESWWLRDGDTKYLAGTCACRSCRLVIGFEIQPWAFVPRTNIFFHVGDAGLDMDQSTQKRTIVPLEFSFIHSRAILRSYESSPGVMREFCPRCGATVFWHGDQRAELIDVSVGLMSASSGARAEDWLRWWTDRVSFSEDVDLGRSGSPATRAISLIKILEEGLQSGRGKEQTT